MKNYLKLLFLLLLLTSFISKPALANENTKRNNHQKTNEMKLVATNPPSKTNKKKLAVSFEDFQNLIKTVKTLQSEVVNLKGRLAKYEKIPYDQQQKPIDDQSMTSQGDQLIFGDNFLQVQKNIINDQAISLNGQDKSFLRNFQPMNPDMSVVGDFNFIGNTKSFEKDRNKFNLREVEIAFESNIDPYSKANIVLGIHKHNHHNIFERLHDDDDHEHEEGHNDEAHGYSLDVEEAYLTLLRLPGGFQSKLGKFYNAFGLLNRVHQPELPQFDRPNVLTNFFGEEALSEIGVNVSKILPTPWFSQIELELTNGENQVFFGDNRISRPLINGHIANAFDISSNSILRLGFSGAFGSKVKQESLGRYTGVEGVDLTYLWVPKGTNKSFKWQTEVLATQLEHPQLEKSNFVGLYSFGEYQFSNRWSTGVRFDYSQVPLAPEVKEYAISPYINFNQTEFARLRFQYKHNFRNFDLSSDQFFIQYTYMLGSHKHAFL